MLDEKPDENVEAYDEEALRKRLQILEKKQEIVTNKATRAEIRYEIAEIQWQLGLITDEEFREAEEFYENFTYEWC
jgi:hypothetical protein